MRLHWTDDSAFGLPIPRKTSPYWREYERSSPKSGAGAQEAEDKKSLVCSTFQRECWRGYLIIIFKTLRKACEEERVKPFSESHSRKTGSNRLRLEHRKFSVKKKKEKKNKQRGHWAKIHAAFPADTVEHLDECTLDTFRIGLEKVLNNVL